MDNRGRSLTIVDNHGQLTGTAHGAALGHAQPTGPTSQVGYWIMPYHASFMYKLQVELHNDYHAGGALPRKTPLGTEQVQSQGQTTQQPEIVQKCSKCQVKHQGNSRTTKCVHNETVLLGLQSSPVQANICKYMKLDHLYQTQRRAKHNEVFQHLPAYSFQFHGG